MRHIVKSIPKPGKLKNGDNYNYIEDDSVSIAIVAQVRYGYNIIEVMRGG